MLTDVRTNDSYAWTGQANVDVTYTPNGLNQYASVNSTAYCYDPNGNLTADGAYVYLYDVENRLVEMRSQGTGNTNCAALLYTGTLKASLRYDPAGRLHESTDNATGVTTRFLYDGDALVGEYNTSGALLRRYVHGSDSGADDPLVWFEGTTATAYTNARHLYADPRGSIVLVGDYNGAALAIDSYDEWGTPDTPSATIAAKGRFRYTGQAWLPELGMYYYKARMYSPLLGRFMQTDPIGYEDQINLYGYVGNDPVNSVDFTGEVAVNCSIDQTTGRGQCITYNDGDDKHVTVTTTVTETVNGKTTNKSVDKQIFNTADIVRSEQAGATLGSLIRQIYGEKHDMDVSIHISLLHPSGPFASQGSLWDKFVAAVGGAKFGSNTLQNKRAADARKDAERITGKKFDKNLQRRFHDRITGQGITEYAELVQEAVDVLDGH